MTTNFKRDYYFYSFEELVEFSKNNTFKDESLKQFPYDYDKLVKKYSGLVIEGFTELVVCYHVNAYIKNFTDEFVYYYLDSSYVLLHEVGTDRYYHIYGGYNATTYELSLFEERSKGGLRYFKYDGVKPNKVGKASRKRLQVWFDYLRDKKEAETKYLNDSQNKREEFIRKVESCGLEVRWERGKNKGWIKKGIFEFSFEIFESGNVTTSMELLYFKKYPSLEQFLALPTIE